VTINLGDSPEKGAGHQEQVVGSFDPSDAGPGHWETESGSEATVALSAGQLHDREEPTGGQEPLKGLG
jgi:hypothetical protein